MVIAAESIFLKPAPWPRIVQGRRSCPVWAGWEVRFQNLCFSSLTAVLSIFPIRCEAVARQTSIVLFSCQGLGRRLSR